MDDDIHERTRKRRTKLGTVLVGEHSSIYSIHYYYTKLVSTTYTTLEQHQPGKPAVVEASSTEPSDWAVKSSSPS